VLKQFQIFTGVSQFTKEGISKPVGKNIVLPSDGSALSVSNSKAKLSTTEEHKSKAKEETKGLTSFLKSAMKVTTEKPQNKDI
jgi:hypothetical protein